MKNKARMLLVMAVALTVTGCIKDRYGEADKSMQKTIRAAKKASDPWQAFLLLSAAQSELEAQHITPDRIASYEESRNLSLAYLKKAVNSNRPEAFKHLYSQEGEGYEELQAATASRFLNYVDTNPVSIDSEILMDAGWIVNTGKFAMRNTNRSVGYFARAWAAGSPQAANQIAILFQDISDYRNAYLWSLRCTAPCKRAIGVELPSLEEHLRPEAAKQIQKVAQSLSVVELDTEGE